MTARTMNVTRALWAHKRIFLFVWLVSLAANLLMLTGPVYMLQIYQRVLPSNSSETLLVLSILMAAMFTGLWLLELVRSRLLARIATHMSEMLRKQLFDLSAYVMFTRGNMTQARRPQMDIDVITNFIGGPAITAFFDMPFVPLYIFVIWLFHPFLAWFALLAFAILLLMAMINEYRLRKPQEETLKTHGDSSGLLHELLNIIETIRALGMSKEARRRWLQQHDAVLDAQLRLRDRSAGLGAMAKAVRLFLQSAMLGLGAWLVLQQEIDAGIMIAASIMLGRALYPVEHAITHWHGLRQTLAARERIDANLEAMSKLPAEPELKPETSCEGRLEARELHLAPPGLSRPLVRNIHFRLEPGQLLLVTGGNGAGKSTLARTLAGIWPPLGTGKVLLDGVDLRQWPEEARGRLIGYVPQDAQLVSGTIAENISRLSPAVTEEEVIAAARRIGVHEAIKKMGGINRQVGPGGYYLSGGEQRKVALARAAWGDPVVYILDEPTADLDLESRKAFYLALLELKKRKRTIVLIDHELPPPQLVDLHLILEGNGQARLVAPERKPAKGPGKYRIMVPKS